MLVTKFIDTIEPGQQRRLSLPLTMPRYPLIPLHGRNRWHVYIEGAPRSSRPRSIDRSFENRPHESCAPVRLFRPVSSRRSMDARVQSVDRLAATHACQRLSSLPPHLLPPVKNAFSDRQLTKTIPILRFIIGDVSISFHSFDQRFNISSNDSSKFFLSTTS